MSSVRLKDRGVNLHMIDLGGDVTGNGISKLVFRSSAVAEASVTDSERIGVKAISASGGGISAASSRSVGG